MNKNSAIGSSWGEVRAELFTPEEIAESNLRVALIGELINARQEKGITQKELEKMMEEVFSSKEIYLESVYKKHLQTKLFLNFLESTFKEYIKETEISMKPKSELKIAILSEVYMEGKEIKQFLYEHNLGYGRTFYYARNELYEELAVRVFGIYALKL